MVLMRKLFLAGIFLCLAYHGSSATLYGNTAHETDSVLSALGEKEEHMFKKAEKEYRKLLAMIKKKRERIVSFFLAKEKQINRANNVNSQQYPDSIYTVLNNNLQRVSSSRGLSGLNSYLPTLDSLTTGLRYLNISSQGSLPQLGNLSFVTGQLQEEWSRMQIVNGFITERYQQMQSTLNNTAAAKMVKKIQKDIVYYQLQIEKYKLLLQHPEQLIMAILQLAKQQPGFNTFMSGNSQLASIFGLSANTPPASLAGLQTLSGTQQQLMQQMNGSGIVNPSQFLAGQINKGNQLVQLLQNKVNQLGGGQFSMPDFKPNMQRTKKFLERWVWGINIQSQRPNGWLPTTSDIGLMTGYQLNDKIIIGGGMAYKMGWGKGISHIKITHEGLGLRLFGDVKLKGSLWISGGYEWNHQASFNRISDLSALSAWQRSGLIGLSKKYSIGKKKGSIQLLWDFLSYDQVPKGRALKFRVGYGL